MVCLLFSGSRHSLFPNSQIALAALSERGGSINSSNGELVKCLLLSCGSNSADEYSD